MKLIIGLGNPGKEYESTRHNIGREIVRALADDWSASSDASPRDSHRESRDWRTEKKLFAEIARYKNVLIRTKVYHEEIVLALPTTYMNDSGTAVQKLLTTYNLQLTTLLVVHDDLDLPLGTLRFSKGSGAAGQKGVESIIDALGTKDFARLRIGVAGEHRARDFAAAYVLKKFSRDEKGTVAHIKQQALRALKDFIHEPLAKVMNTYNAHEVSASRSDV